MKRIVLTLCACMFVCAHDCRADDFNILTMAPCIRDNIKEEEMTRLRLYNAFNELEAFRYYHELTEKYCDDASASSAVATAKPVCASDVRHGKNPETDECIECPVGKFFNINDVANGYCSTAIALSKSDLKYGYKSRTEKSRASSQCWTKKNPSEYKACVKYGMPVYVGDMQATTTNVLSAPATK